jgi:hypothetical protein
MQSRKKMNKKMIVSLILTGLFVTTASLALAVSSSLTVQVYQPKSPTNLSEFRLNFVALETEGNTVTVKCYKKSPVDVNFSQFDGDKILKAGGNSGFCNVTSSVLSNEGTYEFYVTGTSTGTVESKKVLVDYKKSSPGTPSGYSKESVNSCQYKIRVRTADDGGRTSRVALYRSDNKKFEVNPGSEVEARAVGSSTEVEFINSVPDCSKTYYYAVRAWDNVGNGSGLVGDDNTTVTWVDASGNTVAYDGSTTGGQTDGQDDMSIQILAQAGTDDASETDDDTSPSETDEQAEPEVLGAQDEDTPWWRNPKYLVVAGLLGVIIALLRKRK